MKIKLSLLAITTLLFINIYAQNKPSKTDSNKVNWESTLIIEKSLAEKEKERNAISDSKTYWATKIVNYSSQYSKNSKSATQVLGKPNVMPTGGDAKTAWCIKEKKGKEQNGEAYITVGFDKVILLQQIVIAENYNPGAIKRVQIISEDGTIEDVYTKEAAGSTEDKHLLYIFLEKPSSFYVSQVKLIMDPNAVDGQNQIDAIGISDGLDSIKVEINSIPKLVFQTAPENLGAGINTIYDETAPMISPDGKEIYFVRKFHPDNFGTHKDEDDIWVSKLDDNNNWELAQNIGDPLNTKHNNYVQSITPDGNMLLVGNIYDKDKNEMYPGVSLTYRTKKGWAFPEKQNIKDFYNDSQYASYFLSNDGRFLLMSLQRKKGNGKLDLYVSFRKDDNEWEAPIHLGNTINTISNDYSPFLAADGQTLYFSSDGHAGYGKADIFRTSRLDDSWTNWSEPQNLGPVVNSPETDSKYNLPASGEFAYYSSTNKSIGKNDIFKIKLPSTVKPKPVVLISGDVRNIKTNRAIDARIIVEDLETGQEIAIARTDPATGNFKIILPAGKKYGFRTVALGFFEQNKNIDLTNISEYEEVEDIIYILSPIEVGQVVRLNNIFFNTGKATLMPESFLELDRIVEFLQTNKSMEIEISGHTDNIGAEDYNQKLSQNRAQAVANYLIKQGIESNRLKAIGYGEGHPIAFNGDEEGRQTNRRVEFKVLKK